MCCKNIDSCDYSSIDVMIIGHMNEMDSYANMHKKREIVDMCRKHGVDIFSFDEYDLNEITDEISKYNVKCHVPQVRKASNAFGKLYNIKTPVLGILGTSKQQGKFTLQLQIRNLLLRENYKVGQIGTEPGSELFGMYSYPMGYNSNFKLTNEECVESINKLMHEIDTQDNDILLIGGQSGTIPMMFQNVGQIPVAQLAFLMGVMPDGVILCVNVSDDIPYILRTISAIESIADSTVFLLAVYPMQYTICDGITSPKKERIDNEQLQNFKHDLQQETKLPVIEIANYSDEPLILKSIIDFYS